jgi:phage internal scaffolding protein
MRVFLRSPFSDDYSPDDVSFETGVECLEPTKAIQSQAEEADINTIVRRFGVTGRLPENVRAPTYADFDEIVDFQSAQNAIIQARDSFMRMPAGLRARFDNDPGAFVDFCSDEANRDEMVKLGLIVPPVFGGEGGKDPEGSPEGV